MCDNVSAPDELLQNNEDAANNEASPKQSLEQDGTNTMSESTNNSDSLNYESETENDDTSANADVANCYLNILLLSETGVGKSTFINSVANYLKYEFIEKAEKNKPVIPIFAEFKMEDKNEVRRLISVGDNHKKKYLRTGESETQDVKSYIFSTTRTRINLIDTPGLGDTRGPTQDQENCDYILNYLSNIKELHAICILFKPTNSRNTVYFQYCITEILSRLDRSATDNIVFVFTNTRGSDYKPGDTFDILEENFKEIRYRNNVHIPLNKENVFCFDNEAVKYIFALHNNVEFSERDVQMYRTSWKYSLNSLWNMIRYIEKLKPHFLQNTVAINEARRIIIQLSKPMADISEHISDKIHAIQSQERKLKSENLNLEQLKTEIFMPIIDLKVDKLEKPTTICTSAKCSEIYKVGDKDKWHYKQRCHEPCYLKNIQAETVNNPALANCAAMKFWSRDCKICDCNYSVHMHIYYMTTTVEVNIEDVNKLKNINDQEKIMAEVNKCIEENARVRDELTEEHNIIVKSCAKFTHFLQKKAMTPFNDFHKEYLEYLISREEALGESYCNKDTITSLRTSLNTYLEAKKLFDDASKHGNESDQYVEITSKDIQETVQNLYKLKYTGNKIKEMYECQQAARNFEHQYSVKTVFKKKNLPPVNKKNNEGFLKRNMNKVVNLFSAAHDASEYQQCNVVQSDNGVLVNQARKHTEQRNKEDHKNTMVHKERTTEMRLGNQFNREINPQEDKNRRTSKTKKHYTQRGQKTGEIDGQGEHRGPGTENKDQKQ